MPRRKRSLRLDGYDYSQSGAYYVTLDAANKVHLFGEVVDEEMHLNRYGEIVERIWRAIENETKGISLDAYIVMPNHLHGIIVLSPPSHTGRANLSRLMQTFKSRTTHLVNFARQASGTIWQRNFYDHVIRNESDLNRIRAYIFENPLRWHIEKNIRE